MLKTWHTPWLRGCQRDMIESPPNKRMRSWPWVIGGVEITGEYRSEAEGIYAAPHHAQVFFRYTLSSDNEIIVSSNSQKDGVMM